MSPVFNLNVKRALNLALIALVSCTGQLPGAFRFQQQNQTFPDQAKVNTKIDLLWVIDNSSSMDVEQNALRSQFAGFAQKYLKPYWDIRIAVITTDVYLANPVFQSYLTTTVAGTVGYKSNYLTNMIAARAAVVGAPSADPKLSLLLGKNVTVSTSTSTAGTFTNGLKYQDLVPNWSRGTDYARLLPGVHDGPVAGFCMERQPYFLAADGPAYPLVVGPQCSMRDASNDSGTADCFSPPTGTNSVNQCVNTFLNDSVHSGYPIITTTPDAGVTDMNAWVQTLTNRFIVNATTGSAGSGSERGLGSVVEFLNYNETSATAFFRPGSLRGIIFLSDEDDQTQVLPSLTSIPVGFTPTTNYACDLNALVAANTGKFANPSDYIQNQYKLCCASGCALPSTGCPQQTLGGTNYSIGLCVNQTNLMNVSDVKTQLDSFFMNLDGATAATPNYFVVALVVNSATTLASLQAARNQSDDRVDNTAFYSSGTLMTQQNVRIPEVDQGRRYIQLANLVANGSLTLDIGAPDYSVLLDQIGQTIVQAKSVFTLSYSPTNQSEMTVTVQHADGTTTTVTNSQYTIAGNILTITDQAFVLSLQSTDVVLINYQPANLNPNS